MEEREPHGTDQLVHVVHWHHLLPVVVAFVGRSERHGCGAGAVSVWKIVAGWGGGAVSVVRVEQRLGLAHVRSVDASEQLYTKVLAIKKRKHLDSASASHRGAATSLLDQSEMHCGFRCKGTPTCRCRCMATCGRQAPTLHRSARRRETSTHLDSASASHRGAAASLLDSKKPFYVHFRILHAYTIIYLKYRVYCSRGAGAPVLIYGCV